MTEFILVRLNPSIGPEFMEAADKLKEHSGVRITKISEFEGKGMIEIKADQKEIASIEKILPGWHSERVIKGTFNLK